MFINKTHLPNLLGPKHYLDAEHFQRELDRLFMPGWHCLAATSEFPRDGDYITAELLGRPILLWRREGEFQTFLNVCTHRFSQLTCHSSGNAQPYLKCQYHGWEYDRFGDTRKIPDAKSFRPLERGQLGLTQFPTQTTGQLIWVSLDKSPVPLVEYLGQLHAICEEWFTDDYVVVMSTDVPIEANWKIICENYLEGYHTACVHPTTFGMYPDEEDGYHEIHEYWDKYGVDYRRNRKSLLEAVGSWMVGIKPKYTWQHLMRVPNIFWGQLAMFYYVQMVFPVSPTQSRIRTRVLGYPGKKSGLRWRIMRPGLKAWGGSFFPKVNREDARIFSQVQRGLSAAEQPRGGLVSAREERIFPFQKYVLSRTESISAAPQEALGAWLNESWPVAKTSAERVSTAHDSDANGAEQKCAGNDCQG